MPDWSNSVAGSDDQRLKSLLRAIAVRDREAASRLLAESPHLARMPVSVGASREDAVGHFFEEIRHYVYAGDTPLHLATAAYQKGIAEELGSLGADVRARNRRGAEPLHYAADGGPAPSWCGPGDIYAVVALLIGAGADPNAEDKSGVAPLHRGIRNRCTPAVRALLANGADPHRRNKSGSTPLHLAVQDTGKSGAGSPESRNAQSEIIQILLAHGARPSDSDSAGKAVIACVRSGWILDLLENP